MKNAQVPPHTHTQPLWLSKRGRWFGAMMKVWCWPTNQQPETWETQKLVENFGYAHTDQSAASVW